MPKILKKYVSVEGPTGVVSFSPGDELPEWADKLITNPAAFAGEAPADTSEDTTPAAPTVPAAPAGDTGDTGASEGDDLETLKADALKEIARGLGIAARGSKAELIEAIRAKRAESAPAGDAAVNAGDSRDGVGSDDATTGDAPSGDRAALEEQARERGIEFDENTSDEELVAFLEE